jgi:hypothetical protein
MMPDETNSSQPTERLSRKELREMIAGQRLRLRLAVMARRRRMPRLRGAALMAPRLGEPLADILDHADLDAGGARTWAGSAPRAKTSEDSRPDRKRLAAR